jgi:hypothetical protein
MSNHRNVELFAAFQNGDLARFSDIMELHKVDTSYAINAKASIFEAILSTPRSSEFIKRCVQFDASLYLVS